MKNSDYNGFNKDKISALPQGVQKDMAVFLDSIKDKSPEEKIASMLKYKKEFDKFNIDKKVKEDIGRELEEGLSPSQKEAIKKHLR